VTEAPLWITAIDLETKTVTLSNKPPADLGSDPCGTWESIYDPIYTMERNGEIQVLRMGTSGVIDLPIPR
jgi:hypothetical protein